MPPLYRPSTKLKPMAAPRMGHSYTSGLPRPLSGWPMAYSGKDAFGVADGVLANGALWRRSGVGPCLDLPTMVSNLQVFSAEPAGPARYRALGTIGSSYSVVASVRPGALSGGSGSGAQADHCVVEIRGSGSGKYSAFNFGYETDKRLSFGRASVGNTDRLWSTATVNWLEQSVIGFTVSKGFVYLYINGNLDSVQALTFTAAVDVSVLTQNMTLRVGTRSGDTGAPTSGDGLYGDVSDLWLWDVGLTPGQHAKAALDTNQLVRLASPLDLWAAATNAGAAAAPNIIPESLGLNHLGGQF